MNRAVVIGTSSGGIDALKEVLPRNYNPLGPPLIIVIHVGEDYRNKIAAFFSGFLNSRVKEAEDKEYIEQGCIYFAPSGYHLQIEPDYSFSLALGEKINFCRPAIDVLFETAAEVYQEKLTGILLTGANGDGAKGLERIFELAGKVLIQNPGTAYAPQMLETALERLSGQKTYELSEIRTYLENL